MAGLKYFRRIEAAQAAEARRRPGLRESFDFQSLASRSRIKRWFARFLLRRVLPPATAVLRTVCPNPRFGRLVLVTRHADCAEVLDNMARFPVVYGPEMRELGGGADNILSLDGADHDAMQQILKNAFTEADVADVARWSGECAAALLEAGGGRIDVMRDLVTRSSAEVSCRLMGLSVTDHDLFAEWTMALSSLLFGDFTGDAAIRRQAIIARAHLTGVIRASIARHRLMPTLTVANGTSPSATLIGRLIAGTNLSDTQICATIMALITAFTPTNTLAAGNMLEILLENGALYARAEQAARAGDRDALEAALLEAGRLNPALSPGIWRHRPEAAGPTVIAEGSWRARRIEPGDLILTCIPSALLDWRSDAAIRGNARERAWMIFGFGPHNCLGAQLALAHITAVFGHLLTCPQLRPAADRHGREMFRVGAYPVRFDMVWDAPRAARANVLAAVPVRSRAPRNEIERELREMIGNPMHQEIAGALSATGVILFTSLSVIETAPGEPTSLILVEITGDGSETSLIEALAGAAHGPYSAALRHCTADGNPPADAETLAALIAAHSFALHRKPWGATGLHFDGLPGLSVADIDRQDKLADFARGEVHHFLQGDLSAGSRAMDVLLRTRRLIKQDPLYNDRADVANRLGPAKSFEYDLVRPSRSRPAIAGWEPPKSILAPLAPLARSADGRPVVGAMLTAWLLAAGSLLLWLAPPSGSSWSAWTWPTAVAVPGGLIAALALAAIAAGGVLLALARQEKRDWIDERIADLDHVKAVTAAEDDPGHEQNHIVAVMPMKPGLVRRLTFAFSMWWIKQAVSFWFRPGFVVTMGTIHKARWLRVPGTNQFVFFSNYDGSWESYLEDFITRAHEGQSSAWSHGKGFPPTRFLILDGARDGDRFKRWVRRQQRVTAAWYSRFPHLTARQIRTNAMILDGLAHGSSDTDARRWLAQFGSAQRQPGELETQEAQSLVFTGFGRQQRATALFVALPRDPPRLRQWLEALSGARIRADLRGIDERVAMPFAKAGAAFDFESNLPLSTRIRFGDHPAEHGGIVLGLTAAGLALAGIDENIGLDQFPPAFCLGAAARAKRLGDPAPEEWRFSDAGAAQGGTAADAVLLVYGHAEDGLLPEASHDALVAAHIDFLEGLGGTIQTVIPCTPPCDDAGRAQTEREHFGFRDGFSQPAIRGTRRAERDVPARDLVEPGEFLLGYANDQGYLAPAIGVGAEHDPLAILPVRSAHKSNAFPRFGNPEAAPELRDFGRNGSFLVIRQLDQDVQGFEQQLATKVGELKSRYGGTRRLREIVGTEVDTDWLAAKIVGRWRDGSPLVGHATRPAGLGANDIPDNDFAYGTDDPQGLACPLGAHIRRTNPRDSLEPGDPDEQQITNRHRLIRRGRAYDYDPGDGRARGLLFMALCSDIERQFEFVQRTWINARSFHGLKHEADPLLGGSTAAGGERLFSIPTPFGPLEVKDLQSYVALRGAGYFFLPSRSALRFMIHRLETASTAREQISTHA